MSFQQFISMLLLVACATLARPAAAVEMQATSADGFVDSIGVNIHLHYTDTVYWDFAKVKSALQELGVRHVRDGLVYDGRAEFYQRHRELAALGLKGAFIVNGDLTKLKEQVEKLKPAIFALEGPNEVDLNKWKPADARKYQEAFWNTVKNDPELKAIPVIALSSTKAEYSKEMGDLSAWLDFGNIHPYPGGWEPENKATFMKADLASGMALGRENCAAKPVVITETGYTNALNQGGHQPASENMVGVYLPRLFFNCYRNGVVRTYWYELFDLKPDPEFKDDQRHFGLIRNDGVKKPAAWAMKNLIVLLADPGAETSKAGILETLDVTLSDDKAQAMLFQKQGGEFWLALWLPESLWDRSRPYGQKKEVDPAGRPCVITFGAAPARITSFTNLDHERPAEATLPAGKEINLDLSERVTLVRLEMKAQ